MDLQLNKIRQFELYFFGITGLFINIPIINTACAQDYGQSGNTLIDYIRNQAERLQRLDKLKQPYPDQYIGKEYRKDEHPAQDQKLSPAVTHKIQKRDKKHQHCEGARVYPVNQARA